MTKVCIAEDDPDVVESTALLLETYGYDVVTVAQAASIIPTLRSERPDILLQDIRMAGLDLDEHVRRIKQDPELAEIPLVVFSGDSEANELGRRIGAAAVVEKPFDPQGLASLLRRLTEQAPAE